MEEAPAWDESTSLFWCASGVNAYDLPDGREWQREFRGVCELLMEGEYLGAPAARPCPAAASANPDVLGVPGDFDGGATPKAAQPGLVRKTTKVLQRHLSDVPTPMQQTTSPQAAGSRRMLARHPSDPDKRQARALHTAALRQMPTWAGRHARVQGRNVVFFRFEGKVFAADALCPHQGANLWEGEIGDIEDMVTGRHSFVTCPVHKMSFDLETGALLERGHAALGKCKPLRTYKVRIREADEKQRVAMIEVGFESLADCGAYFDGGDAMDEC